VAGRSETYTSAALLALPEAVTITVPRDNAYRRAMTYRAVPVGALLRGVPADATVRFAAANGFAANLQAELLLAGGESARAYVAIEPPDAPWPPLRTSDGATAGPFYLVWMNPEKSRIVPEQWPYQVIRMEEVAPLAKRYPMITPAPGLGADNPVNRGFNVFLSNCIVCHTMNLGGDASIGPDLNVPYNPTEYLRADALRRFIRDPQSQRVWPQARMPAFDVTILSDRDYKDVLAYLRHMTNRKVAVPPAK
jgi:mono/diheme cytochrome c family protein